ncbi:S1C family serine protease [bacterium]|nr:S1C family serine protease [bacterium]
MKILAECPICENRVEIAADQIKSKMLSCDLCKNSFDIQANRIKKKKAPTIVKPDQIEDREIDLPPALPVAATPLSSTALPPTSNGHGDYVVAPATKARAKLKRRRSPFVPILLGLATLASAGALIAVILITDPFRKPKIESDDLAMANEDTDSEDTSDTKDGSTKTQNSPAENGNGKQVFRTDGTSDEVELPPTNAPPDKPPQSPDYRFITKTEIQNFWDGHFWYFVRLRVNTGTESHYVSGTIVDSRGWVATSLSAVANAQEIEIQTATKNLKEINGVKITPTDLVRGVIKMDPGSDLVLLSINRDFVPVAPDVTFGQSTSMVASENVIQCACPGTKNWVWPKEAQLDGRMTYDELDFDFQSQCDDLQLDTSDRYIMHNGYTDTARGAALFTKDGKLVGINTGLTDESSQVLAASVEKLKELISSSEDQPQSLSVLKKLP